MKLQEEEIIKKIIAFARKEKGLTEAVENEILAYFGDKGSKVVDVLKNKRLYKLSITKKLNLWLVGGKDKDYLIIDNNFCECHDFQIRVLMKRERNYCYHLLAKIIGEALKIYDTRVMTAEEYEKLIEKKVEQRQ